ncbi:hypothetical protein F7725_024665, partial [Dissostichus mawsoni]
MFPLSPPQLGSSFLFPLRIPEMSEREIPADYPSGSESAEKLCFSFGRNELCKCVTDCENNAICRLLARHHRSPDGAFIIKNRALDAKLLLQNLQKNQKTHHSVNPAASHPQSSGEQHEGSKTAPSILKDSSRNSIHGLPIHQHHTENASSHLMLLGLRGHLLRDEFDWSFDLPPRPLGAVRQRFHGD